jgi:hypothetical protein
MKECTIDVIGGLLLFGCGVLVAWNGYDVGFGITRWQTSPLIVLGCLAMAAALGVCFRKRLAGIVGSVSMLALAALSFPRSFGEKLIFELWPPVFLEIPIYISTVVFVVISGFVWSRFVLTPRAATRTI